MTIEADIDICEALFNKSFNDWADALTEQDNSLSSSADDEGSFEDVTIVRDAILPPLEVVELVQPAEELAERTGMGMVRDALCRIKEVLLAAHHDQARKKTRQAVISEHFWTRVNVLCRAPQVFRCVNSSHLEKFTGVNY